MRRLPHLLLGPLWLLAACAQGSAAGEDDGISGGADAALGDASFASPADASAVTPDAGPVIADAAVIPDAPAIPDAAPVIPDAAPPDAGCVPTVVNLLQNPGFDDGPGGGWVEVSSGGVALINHQSALPIAPHTPSFAVWLGGYLADPLLGISGIDILHQTFAVPAGATDLQVTGVRRIATQEPPGEIFDTLNISIRSSTGALLETLKDPGLTCVVNNCTYSNAHATSDFTPFILTPTLDYQGQTIRLELRSAVDEIFNTNFFIDTLAARVTLCQ